MQPSIQQYPGLEAHAGPSLQHPDPQVEILAVYEPLVEEAGVQDQVPPCHHTGQEDGVLLSEQARAGSGLPGGSRLHQGSTVRLRLPQHQGVAVHHVEALISREAVDLLLKVRRLPGVVRVQERHELAAGGSERRVAGR